MDLEMTGLDPAKHVIVEIATLVTDDDLEIVAEGPDLVVHQPEEALALMEPIVVEMHTKSGLLDAIRASTVTLEQAGAETLEFIKAHVPEARKVPAVRQLDRHGPPLPRPVPARDRELAALPQRRREQREGARPRWYPTLNSGRPYKAGAHRALDDIRESVAELRFYREHVFVPSRFRPRLRSRSIRPNPVDDVGRRDAAFAHVVEERSEPGQLVRRTDAETQWVGIGDVRAHAAGPRMQGAEVVAGDRGGEDPAEGFSSAPLGPNAGTQRVGLAEGRDRPAALVAGSGPHVPYRLAGERTHRSLMFEAMTVLVGPLPAGVVAVEARATRAAGDDKFVGAP